MGVLYVVVLAILCLLCLLCLLYAWLQCMRNAYLLALSKDLRQQVCAINKHRDSQKRVIASQEKLINVQNLEIDALLIDTDKLKEQLANSTVKVAEASQELASLLASARGLRDTIECIEQALDHYWDAKDLRKKIQNILNPEIGQLQ